MTETGEQEEITCSGRRQDRPKRITTRHVTVQIDTTVSKADDIRSDRVIIYRANHLGLVWSSDSSSGFPLRSFEHPCSICMLLDLEKRRKTHADGWALNVSSEGTNLPVQLCRTKYDRPGRPMTAQASLPVLPPRLLPQATHQTTPLAVTTRCVLATRPKSPSPGEKGGTMKIMDPTGCAPLPSILISPRGLGFADFPRAPRHRTRSCLRARPVALAPKNHEPPGPKTSSRVTRGRRHQS